MGSQKIIYRSHIKYKARCTVEAALSVYMAADKMIGRLVRINEKNDLRKVAPCRFSISDKYLEQLKTASCEPLICPIRVKNVQ